MQNRIEAAAHLLGVEIFNHAGGAPDIGKQDGYLFALSFDEPARRENLFRQMFWHNRPGRSRLRQVCVRRRHFTEPLAALLAKFRAASIGPFAARAKRIQLGAALVAKQRVLGIFALAVRTNHRTNR